MTKAEKSKQHLLEALTLMETILKRENKAFERMLDDQRLQYSFNDDQMEKIRDNLFKQTFIQFISKDFFAWCRFFLDKHFTDVSPDFHYEIVELLFDEERRKMALAAPRGSAKSTVVSLAYPLFVTLNEIEPNLIIISANEGSAKRLVTNIKSELVKNEKIQFFYGNHKSKETWNEMEFIWKETIVSAFGLGMPVRVSKFGRHRPTVAIVDDIETRDVFTLFTNKEQEELQQYKDYLYREVEPAMDPKRGKIRFIGTIFHPEAILPYMLKSPAYFPKIWSFLYTDDDGTERSLWPDRFPVDKLIAIRDELFAQGQADVWWSEYMNKPVAKETRVFSTGITKYGDQELNAKRSGLIYFVAYDLATGRGRDKTASIVIGRDQEAFNNVFVMEYFNEHIEVDEALNKVIDQVQKYNPIKVLSQSDLMAITNEKNIRSIALQRKVNLNLQLVATHQVRAAGVGNSARSKLSKEARMQSIIPWVKSGRLKVHESMVDLLDQMENYPYVRYDDLIEALREAVVGSFPSDKGSDSEDQTEEANRELALYLKTWRNKVEDRKAPDFNDDNMFGRYENLDSSADKETDQVIWAL